MFVDEDCVDSRRRKMHRINTYHGRERTHERLNKPTGGKITHGMLKNKPMVDGRSWEGDK